MKKNRSAIAAAVTVCAAVLTLTSCSELIDFINSLPTFSQTRTSVAASGNGTVTTAKTEQNVIPFSRTPEIVPYELPAVQTDDPVEKKASEITDGAIAKALSYVNAMKDGRHGNESFSFEADANGYTAKLDANEKRYYDLIVSAARRLEHIKISENEYPGDLKKFFFAVHEPLTYSEPDVSSYFTLSAQSYISASDDVSEATTHYRSVFDVYFDPERDANVTVSGGGVTMEKISRDAELLDRVVKRIVSFMPREISTYDRYYYLAAVLSELVSYDKRPDNCFTAYGALIGGRAVCEGYTGAYYLLCREAGLWCAYRNGQPEGQGHTWNMVRLDSGVYNVDVTWCDGYGKPYERYWYDCFMKSDKAFEDDGHSATSGVKCTGDFEPCPYEK